jgi:hypothetical protein
MYPAGGNANINLCECRRNFQVSTQAGIANDPSMALGREADGAPKTLHRQKT